MSQKTVIFASRLVFVGVFMVSTLAFLIWEAGSLLRLKKGEEVGERRMGEKMSLAAGEVLGTSEEVFEVAIEEGDARIEKIRRYLEKYKSPLLPHYRLIFDLSQAYGFEYYWIVAIGQQESNLCKKIPTNSYNCWGYGIHSKGTLRFENYELALRSFAEYLKREYFDKGLNTPELMMTKYCPNSNGSWANGVRQFIDELEKGDF